MENNLKLDLKSIREVPLYAFLQDPLWEQYKDTEGYGDHSSDSVSGDGVFIELEWLVENTPEHEGCSTDDIANWSKEFDEWLGPKPTDTKEEYIEAYTECLDHFLKEMETGEVSGIVEFIEKYNLYSE
jgi:hypothetical protein